jgi:prophage regulatory protein
MTQLLSIKQICELINRDRRTLHVWTRDGKFPQPLRINGRCIGWKESTYNEWLSKLEDA